MRQKPFFSIVIPTLNEEKYLPLLLEDLSKQTFFSSAFEVIHVDGSSDDSTVNKANLFAKKLHLKSVVVKKRNVAFQRNKGAQIAQGKWVIFMDADNRLDHSFLDGIKYQIAKHPNVDVFANWTKIIEDGNINRHVERSINFGLELYKTLGKPAAMGALIGSKKKVLQKIQFDDSKKVFEDSFFVQSAVAKGYVFIIFREPRFILSLRRFNKEGSLKMLRVAAHMNIRYLTGTDTFESSNHGYVMEGGNYYDDVPQTMMEHVQNYLKTASKKQLQQAKSIFNSVFRDPF